MCESLKVPLNIVSTIGSMQLCGSVRHKVGNFTCVYYRFNALCGSVRYKAGNFTCEYYRFNALCGSVRYKVGNFTCGCGCYHHIVKQLSFLWSVEHQNLFRTPLDGSLIG